MIVFPDWFLVSSMLWLPLPNVAEGTRMGAFDSDARSLEFSPAAAEDPVTGIWKGLAKGHGLFVRKEGIPLALWLRRKANDAVEVQVSIEGFDNQSVEGSFEPSKQLLSFRAKAPNGLPVHFELKLDGETCKGNAKTLGINIALEATRVSVDVLEERPAPSAPVDPASLSNDEWRSDLEYLRDYLPQAHLNAFHKISKATWNASIDRLRARIGDIDPSKLVIAMARAVAQIGDAHTGLHWREKGGFDFFPVHVLVFADGVYVVAVDERWSEALCTRVIKIGNHPVDEVIEAVGSVFSAENESWRMAQAPSLLIVPKLLALLDIIDCADSLPLTLEIDGDVFPQVIEAKGEGRWLRAPDARFDKAPRWRTRQGENYWYDVLDEERTVYFAYNSCADDPKRPMKGFIDEIIDAFEISRAERLVIDLRNNSGGNSLVLGRHIQRLGRHKALNGRIFALIGPTTYSSGMLNANQLRVHAGTVLIGEPTGGKPNSYGEVRSFRLPNSGLQVFYSTKYFRLFADSDPLAVEPDVLVGLLAEEFFAGADPVLTRAIEAAVPTSATGQGER